MFLHKLIAEQDVSFFHTIPISLTNLVPNRYHFMPRSRRGWLAARLKLDPSPNRHRLASGTYRGALCTGHRRAFPSHVIIHRRCQNTAGTPITTEDWRGVT